MRSCVAVIGGGISGLAAAHRLTELDPSVDVMLLEAGPRLGGVLQTTRENDFLYEAAADSFLTSPSSAVDLCRRLGLEKELIRTMPTCRQALVLKRGRLLPVPIGFHLMAPGRLWPLLSSSILSWRGKLRAGLEYLLPCGADDEDESLQSFVCRRFGREMFDRLVQPLVGGIYAGDAQRLSIEATFPRFRQMEREHGSLLRAMLHRRRSEDHAEASGARYGQFATLRSGMSSLVTSIADRLPEGCVRLNSPVTELRPTGDGHWLISVGGSRPDVVQVNGTIVAAPARHAARLLESVDTELSDQLRGIDAASCAVVGLGYRREQIAHPLNGFGFVVPLSERRSILSCSFSSIKYAGRAPEESVLMRIFIGGDNQGGLLRLSCDELVELAEQEVSELLQIRGEPTFRRIEKHTQAMPQYHVGHRERIARIDRRVQRFPSLALAGNSLHGVGVPSCIQGGETAAARIMHQLQIDSSASLQAAQD